VVISGCNISARKGSEPVITEIPENLNLCPNQVTNKLTIENTELSGMVKVEIINVLGNIAFVQSVNPLQKVIVIPMQNLQPGMNLSISPVRTMQL